MFKKIEIWILYLTIVLGISFALAFGTLVRQGLEGVTGTRSGKISIKSLANAAVYIARLPEKTILEIFKGGKAKVNEPWDERRPFWDNDKMFTGNPLDQETYLLLSRYNGEIGEAVVELIDLTTFNILHTWNPDISQINSLIDNRIIFNAVAHTTSL